MSETKLNLYQKLLKITDEVGKIEKTGRNSQQGYQFIEQARIVAELRPQLSQHGVFIIPETVSRQVTRHEVTRLNGKQGVDVHVNVVSRFTVINADNPDERFVAEWDGGEAIDSGDKATNKATTASHKYFLMKLFNISDQEDADADSPVASMPTKSAYQTSAPRQPAPGNPEAPASAKQKALITKLLTEQGVVTEDMTGHLVEVYGVMDPKAMTQEQASFVIDELIGNGKSVPTHTK